LWSKMPSGKVHAVATIVTGTAASLSVFSLGGGLYGLIFMFVGALSGLFLSPDLDIEKGSISDTFVRKLFGNVISKVWRVFWYPYGKLSKHRGLSHALFIGTTVRVLYIGTPIILTSFVLNFPETIPNLPYWWLFAGLCLIDAIHILMDKIL